MDYSKLKFETRQIHAGLNHDESTGSRGIAIYPTAAYRFKTCDYAANLFELSEPGNIYTRLQNPTTSAYEERIAALYGGIGAMAVSSGMAGILITLTTLASAGDQYSRVKISLWRNLQPVPPHTCTSRDRSQDRIG